MLEPRRKTGLIKPRQKREGVRELPHPSPQPTQSGFTIVEALVAIILASILLTALTPLLVLAVASRVQARRVDLATQAGRSYVEGLRANAIDPPSKIGANFSRIPTLGVPAPRTMLPGSGVDRGNCLDKNLKSIPCNNANNPPFLVIQAFRDGPIATTDEARQAVIKQGYCVGVRVYRGDAFNGSNYPTEIAPLKVMFTESAGTKNHPLLVMKTQIINQTSFEDYQKRFLKDPDLPPGSTTNPEDNLKPNPCED
jgi:type II secretory pathway pseudopilin PulG